MPLVYLKLCLARLRCLASLRNLSWIRQTGDPHSLQYFLWRGLRRRLKYFSFVHTKTVAFVSAAIYQTKKRSYILRSLITLGVDSPKCPNFLTHLGLGGINLNKWKKYFFWFNLNFDLPAEPPFSWTKMGQTETNGDKLAEWIFFLGVANWYWRFSDQS